MGQGEQRRSTGRKKQGCQLEGIQENLQGSAGD